MATIKGFEVSGTIYENEDETARSNAQSAQTSVNTLISQKTYSTSEVNTGKKWIDDKPIYRMVLTATAGAGPSAWGWAIPQTDFNNIGIKNIISAGVVAEDLQVVPVAVHKTNGFFPMVGMIMVGQRIILEYTKTAD